MPERSLQERKIMIKRPATMDRCDMSAILNLTPVIGHKILKHFNPVSFCVYDI